MMSGDPFSIQVTKSEDGSPIITIRSAPQGHGGGQTGSYSSAPSQSGRFLSRDKDMEDSDGCERKYPTMMPPLFISDSNGIGAHVPLGALGPKLVGVVVDDSPITARIRAAKDLKDAKKLDRKHKDHRSSATRSSKHKSKHHK